MFLRTMRAFSFKPSTKLNFTDKKALIVENDNMNRYNKYIVLCFISLPSAMLCRLVVNYSSMGSINFYLSSGAFLGLSSIAFSYINTLPQVVKSLHLLDDGKHVEIATYGLKAKKCTIKISDILNPEENPETKFKIQYYSFWVIDTRQGETFYVMPETESFYMDVLREILKGGEIDVSGEINEIPQTFIDI